jgi:hypothetical protein
MKENSNFINGNLNVTQLGGPKDWKQNEGGKPIWKLNQNLSYYLGPKSKKHLGLNEDEGVKIILKRGFLTDGGSFNTKLVPFIDATPTGRYFRAFILHDGIARTDWFSFKDTNFILDEALELLEMSALYRHRIYYPLQWFGRATKKEELIENAYQCVDVQFYTL